jgi:hypothetical protein
MILRSSGSPPDQSIGRIDFPCKPSRGPQSGPLHYGGILIVFGFIALRPYVEDRLYSAAGLPGCKPHRQRVGAAICAPPLVFKYDTHLDALASGDRSNRYHFAVNVQAENVAD